MFTLLLYALATACRLRCGQTAVGAEPVGWQWWRRHLLAQSQDQIIVFSQRWSGIFHLTEWTLLVGSKLKEVPVGIGTSQAGLAKYGLTALG
jgi:hypothetical protein